MSHDQRAAELVEQALDLPPGQERGDLLYAANVHAQLALAEAQRGAKDALIANHETFTRYIDSTVEPVAVGPSTSTATVSA